jgi:hypothetical protein
LARFPRKASGLAGNELAHGGHQRLYPATLPFVRFFEARSKAQARRAGFLGDFRDAIAQVGDFHSEVVQAGGYLVDLPLRVSRQRPRNSSRSLRRSSAMPAVTCSMRSKRSSMVIPFLFQCNPPAGGLVLVVRRNIALLRAERRRRPPRDFRIVIGLENACVGAPIQGARQSAAISFDRAARRRKLRGLSAMLRGERPSLGWGVGSLRVSRR